ncbi:MAG TPA: MFS transporter [Methanobacterium sp.]|nr:MFS transporter [Methanobacterium sp.]
MAENTKLNRQENRILLVLFIGVLMGALDISIISPALPAIKSYFQVDTRILIWVFNAYLLSYLIGTPFMAKLSDRSGRKKIYLLNIILFGIGSLISASSFSYDTLLIGRAIQGFGAGGIFPVASAYIGDTIAPERRGSAFGIIGTVFGLAFIIGPLLAGILLNFSWRWLFLINIPVIIILIILSLAILPKTKSKTSTPFDFKGMALLSLALMSLAYGFNSIDINNLLGSKALEISAFIMLGFILLIPLYFVEKRVKDPIIFFDLLRKNQFSFTMMLALGVGAVQAGIIFIPTLAILAFGLGISMASFTLIPLVLTTVIGAPLFGYILDKKGSRFVLNIASIISVSGLIILALFASDNIIIFLISGLIIGLGLSGIISAPLRYIVLNEAPSKDSAAAQSLLSINISFGQIIGAAILGAIIASQGSHISGYNTSYAFLAVITFLMLIITLFLKSRAKELETMQK